MKAIAAKTSVFLFLLYLLWYREAYHHVSLLLYGGTLLVVSTTLVYVDHRPLSSIAPPKGIAIWMGFGAYSLIAGLVVAVNRELLVSSLVTYMAFMLVCWCICIICRGERDIQWLLKCITIVCYVCAIYTLFWGKPYYNGIYVTTMGPENNPNTLGILMIYGMFSVLFYKKNKGFGLIVMLAAVLLFFYVIVLTGSRKSLLGGGLLCVVWLISFVRDTYRLTNRKEKRLKYALLLAVLVIGVTYFVKYYANTASFERLQKLYVDGGASSVRMEMYGEAVDLFKTSILFGIGFNQFRVRSSFGTYSHSTYAEVLADGGIFGCVIFFYPIIQAGLALLKKLRKNPAYQIGMLMALLLVELLLATGTIYIYSFGHLLIWSILYMTVENDWSTNAAGT